MRTGGIQRAGCKLTGQVTKEAPLLSIPEVHLMLPRDLLGGGVMGA